MVAIEGALVEFVDATGRAVGRCMGPTATGRCPRAWEGVVPCAGCRIRAWEVGPEHWMIAVPPGTGECPLGWALGAR